MKAVLCCFFFVSITYAQTPYDDLIKWSKRNRLFIHPNIAINKTNPNEYYFQSKGDISSNTLILSIPKKMLMTADSLYSKSKNKKLKAIWNKLLDTQNDYISIFSTKEMMFIAMIIERSMRKQKGRFYSKYKIYFNSFPENMDNYPLYYNNDELILIKNTYFYDELIRAKTSLEEEEKIIARNFSHSMVSDDYWKYRVITLANSLNIQNKTSLVPLLNLFIRNIDETKTNSQWHFNATTDQLEIHTQNNITKDQMIILQGNKIPNSVSLMYYGFTYEKDDFIAPMIVDVLHHKFKEKLNYDHNFTLYKTSFDIGKQDFVSEIFDVYRLLAVKYGYGPKDASIYQMMIDNIKYYQNEYNKITESDYVKYILSKRNRLNIKRVIETEKRVLEFKSNYLKSLINKIKSDL